MWTLKRSLFLFVDTQQINTHVQHTYTCAPYLIENVCIKHTLGFPAGIYM